MFPSVPSGSEAGDVGDVGRDLAVSPAVDLLDLIGMGFVFDDVDLEEDDSTSLGIPHKPQTDLA